jgi:outer membrane protein assembly factor BamB
LPANGTVYIGCNDSYLYALNGSTGALIWKFKTGFEVFSSPAVGPDGSVYFGSIDGKVYALPPGYSQGGATKWVVQTGNTVYSSASVSADGWVYIGSSDNKVYALSAANGSSKAGWPFVTAGLVASSPALASDGSVYIGSYDGKVYAINPNGTAKWATPFATGGAVRSAPAIGPGGTVIYVGSQDRKLYALNAATGTRIWDYTTGLDVDSSPAVAANGTVIFGSNDNVVYALNSNGGVPLAVARAWQGLRLGVHRVRRADLHRFGRCGSCEFVCTVEGAHRPRIIFVADVPEEHSAYGILMLVGRGNPVPLGDGAPIIIAAP